MADVEFTQDVRPGDVETPGPTGSVGAAMNVAGAVLSLGLIAGVGIWGYKLMMRDVSGVPVVRALEGPMRIQPENPGGRPADYQGLAVNAVAAEGKAQDTADRLVLAPRPVDLTDEDKPLQAVEAEPPEPVEPPAVDNVTMAVQPKLEEPKKPVIVVPEEEIAAIVSEQQAEKPPVIDAPGVARSLRPVARPEKLTVAKAAVPSQPLDVDPDGLPVGTRMAQLGAFDSADTARSEWDKLALRFGDYLEGKQRVIQRASSGGRTFYRLRAVGFADLADARRFCSALVAEKADCIPVVTR